MTRTCVGREADLVAGEWDLVEHDPPGVLVDLLDRILVLRILVELQGRRPLEALLRSRCRCRRTGARRSPPTVPPDARSCRRRPVSGERRVAWQRTFSTNSSPIGTISQSILLPLVPG